jgi:hypothetical protein
MRGNRRYRALVLLVVGCASCGHSPGGDPDTSTGSCGDGILDEGEQCDPLLEEERDCTTSCETAGMQTCSEECEWNECTAEEICGNSVDEDCDGRTGEWEMIEPESNIGVFRVEDAAFDGEGWNVVGIRAGGTTSDGWPIGAIHCRRISRDGSAVTVLRRLTEGTSQFESYPVITSGASGFGLAWTDDRIEEDGREGLAFTTVSDGCELTGDVSTVSDTSSFWLQILHARGEYGIFLGDPTSLSLVRVAPDGSVLGDGSVGTDHGFQFGAFPSVDGWALVSMLTGVFYISELSASGDILESSPLLGIDAFYVRSAFSGDAFGLGWVQEDVVGDTDAYFRPVGLDGVAISDDIVLTDNDVLTHVMAVEWGSHGYGIVYMTRVTEIVSETTARTEYEEHYDLYFRWVSSSGDEVSAPILISSRTAEWYRRAPPCDVLCDHHVTVFDFATMKAADGEFGSFYYFGPATDPSSYLVRVGCAD